MRVNRKNLNENLKGISNIRTTKALSRKEMKATYLLYAIRKSRIINPIIEYSSNSSLSES
jgi:hypothetical protein